MYEYDHSKLVLYSLVKNYLYWTCAWHFCQAHNTDSIKVVWAVDATMKYPYEWYLMAWVLINSYFLDFARMIRFQKSTDQWKRFKVRLENSNISCYSDIFLKLQGTYFTPFASKFELTNVKTQEVCDITILGHLHQNDSYFCWLYGICETFKSKFEAKLKGKINPLKEKRICLSFTFSFPCSEV